MVGSPHSGLQSDHEHPSADKQQPRKTLQSYFTRKHYQSYQQRVFEKDLDQALADFHGYLKNIGLHCQRTDGAWTEVAVDSRKHFSSEVFDRRKYFMHCFISYLAKLNEV